MPRDRRSPRGRTRRPRGPSITGSAAEYPVEIDPLTILLNLTAALRQASRRRLFLGKVAAAVQTLLDGQNIDAGGWRQIFRRYSTCAVDPFGTVTVALTSRAILAHGVLILESSREWRERLRCCPECRGVFIWQRGQSRTFCSKQHRESARQRRHRGRNRAKYREKQRAHYERAKLRQASWA